MPVVTLITDRLTDVTDALDEGGIRWTQDRAAADTSPAPLRIVDISDSPGSAGSVVSALASSLRGSVLAALHDLSVEDVVRLLDDGASDVVRLPIPPDELVARVRVWLRRERLDERLIFTDLTIDIPEHRVIVDGTVHVSLPLRQFDLLVHLARQAGRVVTTEELIEAVWPDPRSTTRHTVVEHVRLLRKALGDDPRERRWIRTIHGVGYMFRDGRRPVAE